MYLKFDDVFNFRDLTFYNLFQSYLAENSELYEQSNYLLCHNPERETPQNEELAIYI